MKAVELRVNQKISDFPIKECTNLHIYSEYFLVDKSTNDIWILRHFNGDWFVIALKSFYMAKMDFSFDEMFEMFDVYCIPEYTGGSDGINEDNRDSEKERKKLLQYLINRCF